MQTETQRPAASDILEQPKKLPGTLNVLTILTLIGCAFSYIGLIINHFQMNNYDDQVAKIEEAQDKLGDNAFAQKMMEGSLEMLKKQHDNRYILLASGLIFTTLCLIGALRMRKLRKSGYPIYVIGEIAPIVVMAALIGFGSLLSGFTMIFTLVISLVFVILYTVQRKHLVND